jgi:hypothetical protein
MAVILCVELMLESILKKVGCVERLLCFDRRILSRLEDGNAKSGEIFPTNEKCPPGNERIESSKNNWMSGRTFN